MSVANKAYDPEEGAGLLIEDDSPIPGRTELTFQEGDSAPINFHLPTKLFVKVVHQYGQNRQARKNGSKT